MFANTTPTALARAVTEALQEQWPHAVGLFRTQVGDNPPAVIVVVPHDMGRRDTPAFRTLVSIISRTIGYPIEWQSVHPITGRTGKPERRRLVFTIAEPAAASSAPNADGQADQVEAILAMVRRYGQECANAAVAADHAGPGEVAQHEGIAANLLAGIEAALRA